MCSLETTPKPRLRFQKHFTNCFRLKCNCNSPSYLSIKSLDLHWKRWTFTSDQFCKYWQDLLPQINRHNGIRIGELFVLPRPSARWHYHGELSSLINRIEFNESSSLRHGGEWSFLQFQSSELSQDCCSERDTTTTSSPSTCQLVALFSAELSQSFCWLFTSTSLINCCWELKAWVSNKRVEWLTNNNCVILCRETRRKCSVISSFTESLSFSSSLECLATLLHWSLRSSMLTSGSASTRSTFALEALALYKAMTTSLNAAALNYQHFTSVFSILTRSAWLTFL